MIDSRYARYFNKTYNRSGTIWDGRHKSSLVQSNCYFLTCFRYIEMNPVVAGMVRKPEEYRWSSYRVNAWGFQSELTQHDEYLGLGSSPAERGHAYRELFRFEIPDEEIQIIERAIDFCHFVGDDRFRKQIEQRYGIKLGQAGSGRPNKQVESG